MVGSLSRSGLVGCWPSSSAPGSPHRLARAAGASVVVALALVVVERAERRAATDAQAAEAAVRRLLQGLGRSTSPDAVVATIVDALRGASGADHVVVARRRPGDRDIEAILVTTSTSVPLATTRLPADLLARRRSGASAGDARGGRGRRTARRRRGLDPLLVDRLQAASACATSSPDRSTPTRRRSARWCSRGAREEAWSTADVMLLETAATELTIALQRAGAQQAAELGARIDALTGLPNRGHFDELAELLSRGRRAGDALGVLMIDIDHFKRINDTFGHAVGDAVLRAVAQSIASGRPRRRHAGALRWRGVRRPAPPGHDRPGLRRRPAHPRGRGRPGDGGPRRLDGRPVSVSIGVAVGEATGETVAELVQRADDALYAAKRRGRDRVVVDEVEVGGGRRRLTAPRARAAPRAHGSTPGPAGGTRPPPAHCPRARASRRRPSLDRPRRSAQRGARRRRAGASRTASWRPSSARSATWSS